MLSFEVGITRIYADSIVVTDGQTRRQAERAAVAAIVDSIIPGATMGHDAEGRPELVLPADFNLGQSSTPFITESQKLSPASQIFISVSHSRRWAVVAIDPTRRIGVDVEDGDRNGQLTKIARRFLLPGEEELITPTFTLLHAWTAKEAAYKAAPDQTSLSVPSIPLTAVTPRHIPLPGPSLLALVQ